MGFGKIDFDFHSGKLRGQTNILSSYRWNESWLFVGTTIVVKVPSPSNPLVNLCGFGRADVNSNSFSLQGMISTALRLEFIPRDSRTPATTKPTTAPRSILASRYKQFSAGNRVTASSIIYIFFIKSGFIAVIIKPFKCE